MADNEANAVSAANDTTSSGSSTRPAAGPLVVSAAGKLRTSPLRSSPKFG